MLNIVICGTPGTGKSSLIEKLKPELDEFHFITVSKFAIENDCVSSYDGTLETHVLDEDKLLGKLEPLIAETKLNIIECIHADILPEDLVSWVYVCRTDNTLLYDRLKARGYNETKIANNVEAEIFQTIYDETLMNFNRSIVTLLVNDEENDLDKNLRIVVDNIQALIKNNRKTQL